MRDGGFADPDFITCTIQPKPPGQGACVDGCLEEGYSLRTGQYVGAAGGIRSKRPQIVNEGLTTHEIPLGPRAGTNEEMPLLTGGELG